MNVPAKCFPVGEYIRDELYTRDWSVRELAERMSGDADIFGDVDINERAIDLLIRNPNIATLGEAAAEGLERAFGVSAATWLDLDRSWREWKKAQEPPA